MALARCHEHPVSRDTKEPYVAKAFPVGFPETAAICGRVGCEHAAYIWLTKGEALEHKRGTRVFGVKTNSVKVRVEGTLTDVPSTYRA